MKHLRKYFADSDLKKVDQQVLLNKIVKGATLTEIEISVTDILVKKQLPTRTRIAPKGLQRSSEAQPRAK